MKKWWLLLIAFICWIITGFILFDVRSANNSQINITPIEISRIISTAPNITEILFALGLEEKITAVTSDSIYPPAAAKKTKIGNFWQPDIEAIIAASPNLVVTLGFPLYPQQQNLADRLRRIGYTCLTVFNTEQIGDLFDAIKKIGLVTQTQDKTNILTAEIQNEIERIVLLTKETEKVRVLYVVQREPLRVAGTDTLLPAEKMPLVRQYRNTPLSVQNSLSCVTRMSLSNLRWDKKIPNSFVIMPLNTGAGIKIFQQ
jgi:ABC-type hemin transport system substrate-binding protein